MNIFEAIKTDHEIIRELLEKLHDKSARSAARRATLPRLKIVITLHQEAEEAAFYPCLLEEKDAREDALESLEEHNVINFVLRELDETAVDDERWRPKLIVLRELYEHHIEEEEDDLFDEAQDILTDEQADEAGKEFMAHKEQQTQSYEDDQDEDEEQEEAKEEYEPQEREGEEEEDADPRARRRGSGEDE